MDSVVRVNNLSIEFHTRTAIVPAVKGVGINIRQGETFGLVGESGCGKTTVAYAVLGYVANNGRIVGGQVLYKGRDLTKAHRSELRRLWGDEIAMVYQDPGSHLNPSMCIGDQIAEIFGRSRARSHTDTWHRIIELLESVRFTDPERVANNYPHQLSGGMQQRVCIAMALAKNPSLLIMDEPTSALDVTTEAVVLDLINDLKTAHSVAILYITHDLGVVARICDRVGVMYMGRMVEEAPVKSLFANPSHPYTQGLLRCIPRLSGTKENTRLGSIPGSVGRPEQMPPGCAFAPRCHSHMPECNRVEPQMVEIAPGHFRSCFLGIERDDLARAMNGVLQTSAPERGLEQPLLMAKDIQFYYSVQENYFTGLWGKQQQVKAVDKVSLKLDRRRTLAVVGESGCGKSTLARVIVGLLGAQDGELTFNDQNIAKPVRQRPKEILNKISIVFQNPDSTLNPKHSIGYTLTNVIKQRRYKGNGNLKEEGIRYLGLVNLGPHYFNRLPHQLSGGEKQRVAVARALASQPSLIVCDEPTSALDVSVQAAVLTLLLNLQNELDLSYLMISHDLSVVHYLSDHIAVMYLGQICEFGRTEEVFMPPYHPYTEALLSAIPVVDPNVEQKIIRLHGRVPSLISIPKGCRFNTRCPRKIGSICEDKTPPEQVSPQGHRIRCHISWEALSSVSSAIRLEGSPSEHSNAVF